MGSTLKRSDFSLNLAYIKNWLDNKPDWKYWDEVGPIAIATNVHIVIVSHFIAELYGMTPEIEAKIASDMKFYDVSEVV